MATIKALALFLVAVSVQATEIRVKHAAGGTDNTYAEDKLQDAIDDPLTVCGDIIEIEPGAAQHNVFPYMLRGPALAHSLGGPSVAPSYAKDCASSGGKYITIRSSRAYQLTPGARVGASNAANLAFVGLLPTFTPSLGCTVFQTERAANYWRIQGLNIAATNGDCNQGGNALVRTTYATASGDSGMYRETDFPNHITIDQCWIHGIDGYKIRDGIQLEGVSVDLLNSTVEYIRATDSESHAITTVGGRGPVRIINNLLSALSIPLFIGGAPSPSKRPIEYVEFSNNNVVRPYKFMDWDGVIDPTPLSPCPLDSDAHGATYHNTNSATYWECRGAAPGTWTSISSGAHAALVAARLPYPGKNLSEFKSATRWHIEGNVFDQGSQLNLVGQRGSCFNWSVVDGLDATISEMTVENNLCKHAGWGYHQGSDPTGNNTTGETVFHVNGGRPLHHNLFRNNLFQHMGQDWYTQPFGYTSDEADTHSFIHTVGFASFAIYTADTVTLDHQTFQSEFTGGGVTSNTGARIGDLAYDPAAPTRNQRITNSIWTAGKAPVSNANGVTGPADRNVLAHGWGPYAELTSNGIVDNLSLGTTTADLDGTRFHCTPGQFVGCPYLNAFNAGPANCLGCFPRFYKTPTEALFTNYPDDLTLQAGSPFKAAALDGKDLGADLNIVGWATAGAEAGALAPYLAMKIRGVVPTSTTVAVRFSAIDTSSCTVEARKYGFPLSSPVATATVNTGDLDRTATLTGLSGNTKYGLKVTCAGSYYREDAFRTP